MVIMCLCLCLSRACFVCTRQRNGLWFRGEGVGFRAEGVGFRAESVGRGQGAHMAMSRASLRGGSWLGCPQSFQESKYRNNKLFEPEIPTRDYNEGFLFWYLDD